MYPSCKNYQTFYRYLYSIELFPLKKLQWLIRIKIRLVSKAKKNNIRLAGHGTFFENQMSALFVIMIKMNTFTFQSEQNSINRSWTKRHYSWFETAAMENSHACSSDVQFDRWQSKLVLPHWTSKTFKQSETLLAKRTGMGWFIKFECNGLH